MNYALNEDMNVNLARHDRSLASLEKRLKDRTTTRHMQLVRDLLSAGVASYFRQWKSATDFAKTTTHTKYRDMVYNAYRQNMLRTFLRWKDGTFKKKKRMKKMQIQELTMQNDADESTMHTGQQKHRKENVAVCSVATKKASKGAAKLQKRILKGGLYQWKRRVEHLRHMKELTDRISLRRQRRQLESAWDRYKGFLLYCRQHDRNVDSASELMRTFRDRTLRRHFNAYCAFCHR